MFRKNKLSIPFIKCSLMIVWLSKQFKGKILRVILYSQIVINYYCFGSNLRDYDNNKLSTNKMLSCSQMVKMIKISDSQQLNHPSPINYPHLLCEMLASRLDNSTARWILPYPSLSLGIRQLLSPWFPQGLGKKNIWLRRTMGRSVICSKV